MGTKFQYAINPLAASSNNSFLVNQISDCGYPLEIGPTQYLESSVNHFNHSVDEMSDIQNIESIKKTMLMQDDIFKRQVRELHQLYERQMKLMYELKNQMPKDHSALNMKDSNHSGFTIWNQPIPDIKSDLPVYALRDDPLELSASCSGESPRMPKRFNLERSNEEHPSTSIRGSEQDQKGLSGLSGINNGPDDDIDVELTLSIGCSRSKKALNSKVNHCRMEFGSSDSNCSGGEHQRAQVKGDSSHAISNSSARLNQNIAPSNWFFQDLSLNRT